MARRLGVALASALLLVTGAGSAWADGHGGGGFHGGGGGGYRGGGGGGYRGGFGGGGGGGAYRGGFGGGYRGGYAVRPVYRSWVAPVRPIAPRVHPRYGYWPTVRLPVPVPSGCYDGYGNWRPANLCCADAYGNLYACGY